MSWDPFQREVLGALGYEVMDLAPGFGTGSGTAPAGAASAGAASAGAAPAGAAPAGAAPPGPKLLAALLRAAGRTGTEDVAGFLRECGWQGRADPAAKRALWPKLRAMRAKA